MFRHIAVFLLLAAGASATDAIAYPPGFEILLESAQEGDVRARVEAGMVYFYGREGGIDYGEALRWFGRAAADDDPLALYFLGAIHGSG